jgi:hypothetical protein
MQAQVQWWCHFDHRHSQAAPSKARPLVPLYRLFAWSFFPVSLQVRLLPDEFADRLAGRMDDGTNICSRAAGQRVGAG